MSRCWAGLITVLALIGGAQQSEASALFTGSANGLSASASFKITGASGNRQLTILLTNTDAATGSNAPDATSEILTGLFFNLGTSTFKPVSATIEADGSIVQTSRCDVACAGDDGGTTIGGANFGLVPDGWVYPGSSYFMPSGLKVPLTESTVKFVLNIPKGLEETDISNVYFTYGGENK